MSNAIGLRLHKLDLHIHTPASRCYTNEDSPDEIVRAALEKGLDAIAITDHNTGAWIDKMKKAADSVEVDDRKLVIFPGVEISTHEGFHVVALFDPSVGQAEVENFLGLIDFTPEDFGRSDATCSKSVYELLKLIHSRDGLAVLAHIDDVKGAFKELTSLRDGKVLVHGTCAKLFNEGEYDAVEVVGGQLPPELNKKRNIHRIPAFYQASDNPNPDDPKKHAKEGIGLRTTYFNLDELSLEGLRQCFADPDVRIILDDEPEAIRWPHIKQMIVGRDGYLAYQQFHFHPGLNCIIGGKGVGKSLAVEFLRFALDQPSPHDELARDHQDKIDHRLEPFNSVEIEFELANGVPYVLRRTYEGNGDSSWECINETTDEPYSGNIQQLFPILAYSQTEVIKIAESESAQLDLIDSLIDPRPFQQEIKRIQSELDESDRKLVTLLNARASVGEAQQEVATLKEKIANIDRALSSPLVTEIRVAQAKRNGFDQQLEYLNAVLEALTRFDSEIEEIKPVALEDDCLEDETLQEQYQRSVSAQEHLAKTIRGEVQRITENRGGIQAALDNWLPEFNTLQKKYDEELQGSDYADLEAERKRLDKQLKQATKTHKQLKKQSDDELPKLLQDRDGLLDQLDQQYQSYHQARHSKFDALTRASNGRVRLQITHATNVETYAAELKSLWRGQSANTISVSNRRKIAETIFPRELGDMIISRDIDQLSDKTGLTTEMAERAMSKLWANDDLVRILAVQHTFYPDDTPIIEFNKGNDNYARLDELSVGQKSTALLIIALCDGQVPVIIDQPEDALDIASVWEDVAKQLRARKKGRQFILPTHNSSLAVGSDSDTFMVLTPQGADRAKVSYRGAIDRSDVRRAVIDHLEGGDEPYMLKQKKYNIQ